MVLGPDRDRNNHALNVEQCDSAFPDLYHEIDRSAAFWRERNGGRKITKDQYGLDWSEDGGLSVMIYDQQLYVTYSHGLNDFLHWEERSKATLQNITRAVLASPDPVPNMEFSIKINDRYGSSAEFPNATTWVFSRNITDVAMKQVWLMPDFNFWSYPWVAGSYADFQRQTLRIGDDFAAKEDKLVWRGTINLNFKLRDALIQQTKHQPWADVRKVAEDSNDEESLRNHISVPDHCKYKYTIHTEGWAWSGRLKYLWSCHSVIFIHHLVHHTHLYHLLEFSGPKQNYVQVESNFSDLPAKMGALLAEPAEGRRIADVTAETFRDRYVTPTAQTCYWRRLLTVWASVTEEVDPWETVHIDGSVEQRWRGMTFEEYIFYKDDYPVQPNKIEVKNTR
ncbi:hypothetical protein LTR22_027767 [Elasticomyces elasticus]|nr:hypothetical protein LTR22_027767 [Elasticomyces elasticus]